MHNPGYQTVQRNETGGHCQPHHHSPRDQRGERAGKCLAHQTERQRGERRSQDDGAVTIRSQSVSGWIAAQPERLRMTNMQTTWKLSPAGGNQVRVELWGSGEPGGLIPAVLYNYNLADDATQTLRQLRRMALREKYLDNRSASRTRP